MALKSTPVKLLSGSAHSEEFALELDILVFPTSEIFLTSDFRI